MSDGHEVWATKFGGPAECRLESTRFGPSSALAGAQGSPGLQLLRGCLARAFEGFPEEFPGKLHGARRVPRFGVSVKHGELGGGKDVGHRPLSPSFYLGADVAPRALIGVPGAKRPLTWLWGPARPGLESNTDAPPGRGTHRSVPPSWGGGHTGRQKREEIPVVSHSQRQKSELTSVFSTCCPASRVVRAFRWPCT